MRATTTWLLLPCLAVARLAAQQPELAVKSAPLENFLAPVPVIEQQLTSAPFEIMNIKGARFTKDKTERGTIMFADSTTMTVKIKPAGAGADEFNNRPRYELAAYQLQKLFLDPDEYVVPPTVLGDRIELLCVGRPVEIAGDVAGALPGWRPHHVAAKLRFTTNAN